MNTNSDFDKGYSAGAKEAIAYKNDLDEILYATRAIVAGRGKNSEIVTICKDVVETHFKKATGFEEKSGLSVGNAKYGRDQFYGELKNIEDDNE